MSRHEAVDVSLSAASSAPARPRGITLRRQGAVAVGALALAALAVGVLAIRVIAIGWVAVGQLPLGRARPRGGLVDELRIAKLTVEELRVGRTQAPELGSGQTDG